MSKKAKPRKVRSKGSTMEFSNPEKTVNKFNKMKKAGKFTFKITK